MDQTTLARFKSLFDTQKRNLLYTQGILNEDFNLNKDDLLDEVDLTSTELEQSMRMRLRNRETFFLKKIDEALARIHAGTFGDCLECGQEIDIRRLEARPTAALCIHCKEEEERRERIHADSRNSKSLGQKPRLRIA